MTKRTQQSGSGSGKPSPEAGRRFIPRLPRRPASAHRINLKFLLRTIRLARPYWFSDEKRGARALLALLILLLVGYTWFSVLFNQQSGEFTSALAARDGGRFWHS